MQKAFCHSTKRKCETTMKMKKRKKIFLEYMYFILDRYGCNMKAVNETETPTAQSKVLSEEFSYFSNQANHFAEFT